jgi:hypothetical protein
MSLLLSSGWGMMMPNLRRMGKSDVRALRLLK